MNETVVVVNMTNRAERYARVPTAGEYVWSDGRWWVVWRVIWEEKGATLLVHAAPGDHSGAHS